MANRSLVNALSTPWVNTATLLHCRTTIVHPALRPEVITHRHRPGFVECQDGRWLVLPATRRAGGNRPKARRRLWHWLAGSLCR